MQLRMRQLRRQEELSAPVCRNASYTTIDTALERLRLRTPASKIGIRNTRSLLCDRNSLPRPLVSPPKNRNSPRLYCASRYDVGPCVEKNLDRECGESGCVAMNCSQPSYV